MQIIHIPTNVSPHLPKLALRIQDRAKPEVLYQLHIGLLPGTEEFIEDIATVAIMNIFKILPGEITPEYFRQRFNYQAVYATKA